MARLFLMTLAGAMLAGAAWGAAPPETLALPTSHPITSLLFSPSPATAPASRPATRNGDAASSPTTRSALPTSLPADLLEAKMDGRVNLNTATAEALAQVPGLDPIRAAIIVEYRAVYGPFESLEGLLDVQGISERRLALARGSLYVKTPTRLSAIPASQPTFR